MTTITTYRCDKCGAETTKHEDMSHLALNFNPTVYASPYIAVAADWCRACATEYGLIRAKASPHDEDPPPPKKPNLDDLVRELVREEIANTQEES